jgi:hypothetical protein
MPCSTCFFNASITQGGERKSISATQRGIKSFLPKRSETASNFTQEVFLLSITSSKLYFILFPINIYVYRFRLYLHNPSGEFNPQMQLFTKMRKIFVKVCHNSRYFLELQIYGKQFTSYNNEKIAIKLKLNKEVCFK